MHHIVYLSEATRDFDDSELQRLLVQWRARNRQRDITGVLLYREGRIIQVLEGEAPAVQEMYARIAADARHCGVVKLADGAIARREFADWSMGFVPLSAERFTRLRGYFDPATLCATPTAALEASVLQLLKQFASEPGPRV